MMLLLKKTAHIGCHFQRSFAFTGTSHRHISLIAREIITGNDSCLIGDWNNGGETRPTITTNLLLLIHHHLVGVHKDHTSSADNMFQSLQETPTEEFKRWTEYDKLLYSACVSLIKERNYMKAAVALETLTSRVVPDPAILKLTQELYLLAGRSDLLLKSVIRYPSCFHVSDDFRPSIFGMLCAGYAELGYFQEADEIARKSRAMSTEVDVNLIATIIDGHNLSGKSSEVKTVIDEESIKYRNLGGLGLLQCGQSTALFIRGNINFCYNELISIYDVDHNNNTATHEPDFVYNMPVLLKSSLLLLQVLMNLIPKHTMELDRIANMMNQQLRHHSKNHHHYSLLQSVLFATQYVAVDTMNHSRLLTVKPTVEAPASTSMWASIFGSTKPKSRSMSNAGDLTTVDENKEKSSSTFNSNNTKVAISSPVSCSSSIREEELAKGLIKLNTMIDQIEKKLQFEDRFRPYLPTLDSQNGLTCLYPTFTDSCSSHIILSHADAIDVLSLAIAHFSKRDHDRVVQLLAILYQRNYAPLGFSVAQRDVVHQLFIESLLRGNYLHSAKILLIERTVLVPNDGQTWRRLSIVHDLLGQKSEAEEANYTAWQLGIGQGGYGGAE